jgi:hypothetical protein
MGAPPRGPGVEIHVEAGWWLATEYCSDYHGRADWFEYDSSVPFCVLVVQPEGGEGSNRECDVVKFAVGPNL